MTLSDLTAEAARRPLDATDIATACEALLDESRPVADRSAFLRALHLRGETAAELAAFAHELLNRAVPFPCPGRDAIDVCGTGGDRSGSFNISTATMFVASGAGARVVKHGNRGITSRCGGADVLAALGIRIDAPPEASTAALETAGCCFLFAPAYHPAVKAVAPVRAALAGEGLTSVFNLLGPLINPARPRRQLVGLYAPELLDLYAGALAAVGRDTAWVVNGRGPDGCLDEISTLGPTSVREIRGPDARAFTIEPGALGFEPPDPTALAGGTAEQNAAAILAILEGHDRGPKREIVVLNAAAALVVAGRAADLPEGISRAAESIDSGSALASLRRLAASAG